MAKTAARKGRKRRTRGKQSKGSMWPWYLVGVLSIGAAIAYDHRAQIMPAAAPFYTASIAKARPSEQPVERAKPALAASAPEKRSGQQVKSAQIGAGLNVGKPGKFYFCTDTFENCVVDGGTFWIAGRKVRIAGIEAPKIKQAKCDDERKLGSLAKRRLWEILNAGEVHLAAAAGNDIRVLNGEGRSVGDVLVAEGLARRRAEGQAWCAAG